MVAATTLLPPWASQSTADGSQGLFLGLSNNQAHRLLSLLELTPAVTESLVGKINSSWLIHSGASYHMTGNLDFFSSTIDIHPSLVGLPNGVQTNAVK